MDELVGKSSEVTDAGQTDNAVQTAPQEPSSGVPSGDHPAPLAPYVKSFDPDGEAAFVQRLDEVRETYSEETAAGQTDNAGQPAPQEPSSGASADAQPS